jgi:hypothetical protein
VVFIPSVVCRYYTLAKKQREKKQKTKNKKNKKIEKNYVQQY